MPMPWQLRNAKRPKRATPRPRVNVNDLQIPKTLNTAITLPWVSLRYPFLNGAKLTANMVQFAHIGRIQSFPLKWIRTGYGLPRFAFICTCARPVISLYFRCTHLACRRCQDATYASRTLDKASRPILQATRLSRFLEILPAQTKQTTRKRLTARYTLKAKTTHTKALPSRFDHKALAMQSNYNTQGPALWR